MTNSTPILALEGVHKHFKAGRNTIRVLQDVSLSVTQGEIVCLVGESGCGKTTTGKIIAGLSSPTMGKVFFEGQDVRHLSGEAFNAYRRAVQIVHQDPYASLNPTQTLYRMLSFPLFRHRMVRTQSEARARVLELLQLVDLTPPEDFIDKFPHQLSGGQRQRVSIARALTVNPRLIVADEPVSMVDVSIRVSLLNTLSDLQRRLNLTFVFITHDLAVARYFAWEGRIAVMYLGRIVELGSAPEVTAQPQHPYTRALITSLPEPDPQLTRNKQRIGLRSEDIPSLLRIPNGCAFHPRCPWHVPTVCDVALPELARTESSSLAACHVTAQTAQHAAALAAQAQESN
ncbi:MAG: ABC transporter ATP-binding protein [Chloroflexi bacterium CFX4]|nr:ABC transporter ATP-binding protein [Chloroflexi bacterium CFX4]MDL1922369.1 ABC transporter ATP-binding protein [Chloroflexi bacterium CFX3]